MQIGHCGRAANQALARFVAIKRQVVVVGIGKMGRDHWANEGNLAGEFGEEGISGHAVVHGD